jgi:hypothetical protein
VVFVHLEAFSRHGLALVDAVAVWALACFPGFANSQRNAYSLMRLEFPLAVFTSAV